MDAFLTLALLCVCVVCVLCVKHMIVKMQHFTNSHDFVPCDIFFIPEMKIHHKIGEQLHIKKTDTNNNKKKKKEKKREKMRKQNKKKKRKN